MKTVFDFPRWARHHRIPLAPEGHRHVRPGWAGTPCPFCSGHEGFHLGYHLTEGYFRCWRCKWHAVDEVVSALLSIGRREAVAEIACFSRNLRLPRENKAPTLVGISPPPLPSGFGPLTRVHKKYLTGRGLDPDTVERVWGIGGTGPVGTYRWRVVAPVFHEGQLVSYTGRSIGAVQPKWKSCPKALEARPITHCLYGLDLARDRRSVVIVEGPADAWRLGPGALATFGIGWTPQQARLIETAGFAHATVAYDGGEPEAQRQARSLADRLSWCMACCVVDLGPGVDPSDVDDQTAQELMHDE